MIIDGEFWAGVGLLALLTLSPGASWALVSAVAARHGRRAAVITALGIASGIIVHSVVSALGISVVLAASAEAFVLIRTVGAAYLAYLGVRTLVRSGRQRSGASLEPSKRDFYARGALTNLLNVQVMLFYLTFLPQFVRPGEPVLAKSLLFGVSHAFIAVSWFTVYAHGVTSLASRVRALQPWIERVSGVVLIGFAVWLVRPR